MKNKKNFLLITFQFLFILNFISTTAGFPLINFVSQTPTNATSTTNTSIQINISIIQGINPVNEVKFNWNLTNYTIYDDSLILMYNFENLSSLGENATRVIDLSKYQNNGTLVSSPTYNTTCKFGGCYNFVGANDRINVSLSSTTKNFTFSFWVKSVSTAESYLFDSELGRLVIAWKDTTEQNSIAFWDTSVWRYLEKTSNVADNNWHNLIFVTNSTNITYYRDGNLINITPYTNPVNIGNKVSIGSYYDGGTSYNFNGSIDEFRIWNRSLSANEVYEIYSSNLQKYNQTQWYLYVNQ